MTLTHFRLFFIEFEKEEIWINKMASKGFDLSSLYFGFYEFTYNPKIDFVYNIILLDYNWRYPESSNTLLEIRNSGAEIVFGIGKKVYLRKKKQDGPFNAKFDLSSRLKYYKFIRNFLIPVSIFALISIITLGILAAFIQSTFYIAITLILTIFSLPLVSPTISISRKIKVLKETLYYLKTNDITTEI